VVYPATTATGIPTTQVPLGVPTFPATAEVTTYVAATMTAEHRTPGCAANSLDAQDQVRVSDFNAQMLIIANNIEKIAYFINNHLRPLALSNKANFNQLMSALSPDTGIKAMAVSSGGAGYVEQPTVEIDPPVTGGRQATAYAQLTAGAVSGVVVTDPGTGYTKIQHIKVVNGGSGYSNVAGAVTVTVAQPAGRLPGCSQGGGSCNRGEQATATVTVTSGVITSVTVTNAGSGYTEDPSVTITGSSDHPATLTAERAPAVRIVVDDGDTSPSSVATATSSVDVGHGLAQQCSHGDITLRGFRVTSAGSGFSAAKVPVVEVTHPGQVSTTLCPTEANPSQACGYTAPSSVSTGTAVLTCDAADSCTVTGITMNSAGAGYQSLKSYTPALPVVTIHDTGTCTDYTGDTEPQTEAACTTAGGNWAVEGHGATGVLDTTCALQ